MARVVKRNAIGTAYRYWVCVDCYYAHHGIEDGTGDTRSPLSQIPEGAEVTSGMLRAEHAEDCPNREEQEWVEDCECETITFTWNRCDGCGSRLGGTRHALTVWE